MARRILATMTIIVFTVLKMYGQTQDELYKEIYKQDSIFFSAFNHCDTAAYRNFLTNDFEFYHDLGGLHYLDEEMQSIREMCARNSHIRRELLKNTLEIHKLGETGALEIGIHRFYHTNPGQAEHISGTYKFIHVWQQKDKTWKLSRVISYDHGEMNNH